MYQFGKRMVSTYGYRGFFAGCNPAIIQIIPYMGLNFALYETFLRVKSESKFGKVSSAALAGTFAGGLSKVLIYPMDTVKKRIQAQTFSTLVKPGQAFRQYNGMLDCIVKTSQEEGLIGFYRGMVPSVIKNAAATGLSFAFFTMAKVSLESIHDASRSRDKM